MSDSKENIRKYSVLEIIGALVGASGLLGAFAWYFGKAYYGGYSEAMGIPFTDVNNISSNDFISAGSVLLLYFILLASLEIGLTIILRELSNLISKNVDAVSSRFLKRSKPMYKKSILYFILVIFCGGLVYLLAKNQPIFSLRSIAAIYLILLVLEMTIHWLYEVMITDRPPSQYANNLLTLYRIVIVVILVSLTFQFIAAERTKSGYEGGCIAISNNPYLFTIYSDHHLPLENETNYLSKRNLFMYSGYRGFIGNDYLVLYRELNTETSQPRTIYYIKKSDVFEFSVSRSQSASELKNITKKCKALAKQTFSQ